MKDPASYTLETTPELLAVVAMKIVDEVVLVPIRSKPKEVDSISQLSGQRLTTLWEEAL